MRYHGLTQHVKSAVNVVMNRHQGDGTKITTESPLEKVFIPFVLLDRNDPPDRASVRCYVRLKTEEIRSAAASIELSPVYKRHRRRMLDSRWGNTNQAH